MKRFAGSTARRQRGLSLIELLIAAALASIIIGTLLGVTLNGVRAQAQTREANEMAYQARFATGLIAAKAQASPPKVLSAAPANSSGDWFGATMYCLNTVTAQLIETTPADTACAGSRVVADNVTAFVVEQPAAAGAVDRPTAKITLTVATPGRTQSVTLTTSARLGGGTL